MNRKEFMKVKKMNRFDSRKKETDQLAGIPGIYHYSNIPNAYKGDLSQFLKDSKTSPEHGLTTDEANRRRAVFGENVLREKKERSFIQKILDQFKDFMVLILIIASVVSGALGEWVDALVILAIVVVNAILGVVQEGKAEKAIAALQKMSAPNAKVIRNGELTVIPAGEIVPGDICMLEAGDIIPADMRLIDSTSLKIEEASLTGESVPAEKDAQMVFTEDTTLGDRLNMGYMSTAVTYGHGKGLVVATSSASEIGSIAEQLQDIREEATPLQRNLNQLGKILGILCLIVCGIVFVQGILMKGEVLQVFMTAVSLAVAAIPEGLPAVVTIVLALGMKRMADKNAIMKQLLAVETLGSVDVICSDKTGTLTQNEMTVTRLWADSRLYAVTGSGYQPDGTILDQDGKPVGRPEAETPLDILFRIASLCNDARIIEDKNEYSIIGDPTEGAVAVAATKAGIENETLQKKYPRITDLPFDSQRKMMTTFHHLTDPSRNIIKVSYTKGAPDIILKNCSQILTSDGPVILTDAMRTAIMDQNKEMAQSALRVLGFSYKDNTEEGLPESETQMVFVGLMGMIDPERPEARDAIALCNRAGIRAIMITGDFKETAMAIAKNLGLMKAEDQVMTGPELDNVSDQEMPKVVDQVAVYARVSPEHKVRIVTALRKNGHIAAMTGDGVNDAMALKRADIGVAMGITGTEVAKGTANMILTDDNFATIVTAVEEGRIIYSNIRKFVGFLLSCNVGEILVIFITSIVLGPRFIPLLPIQLLWLNLVTDSFPALALGREPGEPDIMDAKPRSIKARIVDRAMGSSILTQSIAIFFAVFAAFQTGRFLYPDVMNDAGGFLGPSMKARTFAFVTLICAELLRAFSCRSEHASVFRLGIFKNKTLSYAVLISFTLMLVVIYTPFLQPIFSTTTLLGSDWLIIISFALIPFVAGEFHKFIIRRLRKMKGSV
jgi:P-type Ca2+ transporter type 2C